LQNTFNTCPLASFKVCTSMPEYGEGWPKHVGYCNRKALGLTNNSVWHYRYNN
jgi:hypothetical protein